MGETSSPFAKGHKQHSYLESNDEEVPLHVTLKTGTDI